MNQNYLCRNYMVTYFHIEVTAINVEQQIITRSGLCMTRLDGNNLAKLKARE